MSAVPVPITSAPGSVSALEAVLYLKRLILSGDWAAMDKDTAKLFIVLLVQTHCYGKEADESGLTQLSARAGISRPTVIDRLRVLQETGRTERETPDAVSKRGKRSKGRSWHTVCIPPAIRAEAAAIREQAERKRASGEVGPPRGSKRRLPPLVNAVDHAERNSSEFSKENVQDEAGVEVPAVVATRKRPPAPSVVELPVESPEASSIREFLAKKRIPSKAGDGEKALRIGHAVMAERGLPSELAGWAVIRCLGSLAKRRDIDHAGFLFSPKNQGGYTVLTNELRKWLDSKEGQRAVPGMLYELRHARPAAPEPQEPDAFEPEEHAQEAGVLPDARGSHTASGSDGAEGVCQPCLTLVSETSYTERPIARVEASERAEDAGGRPAPPRQRSGDPSDSAEGSTRRPERAGPSTEAGVPPDPQRQRSGRPSASAQGIRGGGWVRAGDTALVRALAD